MHGSRVPERKLVCTGAKSEAAAKRGARIYAAIIAKIGFPVQFTGFRLQNVVATVNVGFPIRLEALAFAHNTRRTSRNCFPG